jgi:hypothetical protein
MKGKAISLQDILESEGFRHANGTLFQRPGAFLENLFDSPEEVTVQVDKPTTLVDEDSTERTAYGRFVVQERVSTLVLDEEIYTCVGIQVATDLSQPRVVLYAGTEADACTNLAVWRAEDIVTHQFLNTTPKMVSDWFNRKRDAVQAQAKFFEEAITRLKTTFFSLEEVEQIIGKLLCRAVQRPVGNDISIQQVTAAARLLSVPSPYTMGNRWTSAWTILGALTEHLSRSASLATRAQETLATVRFFQDERNFPRHSTIVGVSEQPLELAAWVDDGPGEDGEVFGPPIDEEPEN